MYKIFSVLLVITFFAINVGARRECIVRKVKDADTVCVCNSTYCDDFPALKRPKTGFLTVYESNKAGERFKETELQFGSTIDSTADQTVVVTIDKTQKYQTIFGFGGAFTDTTGQMLKTVNQSLADLLIDSYFSDNGIEYSMARIPMAGTDFSYRPYSYDDVDGDLELKHFALQMEDLEWKIPYIQRALKVSPHKIKFFGSPWSPPSWMKTNNMFNHGGELRGTVGGEYYQSWANYFVKFLDAYKSHDINLWGLTVENEPTQGGPGKGFNCLNLTGPMERDFVKLNLGPTLAKAGYGKDKLNLMVFDDNLSVFEKYLPTVLEDREAAKYVSGIAYHHYGGYPDGFPTEIQENYTDMFLLNTEACHLEGPDLGVWSAGENYASDIIRALNEYVRGWLEWNMALDMSGGPRWNEQKGYGGAINIDPTKGEAYKQPSFYAIGHFSKFIPPESVRIGHTVDKSVSSFTVLTVQRPDNQTVLVALNTRADDIVLTIQDSSRKVSHKIPAHSLQSYIW